MARRANPQPGWPPASIAPRPGEQLQDEEEEVEEVQVEVDRTEDVVVKAQHLCTRGNTMNRKTVKEDGERAVT